MQFDLKNAQVIIGDPGDTLIVLDSQGNALFFRGDFASGLRDLYQEQLRTTGAGQFKMSFQINVEVQEPTGLMCK